MELRHLRYFQAVVEAGSLTAAAANLHMSQPPLSVAISQLEAAVGVELLVRTSRGVEPTSAGRYLVGASSRVLGDIDDILGDLRRFGSGAEGALTIAAVPVLMWHRVPRLVRRFATAAPGVEVRLLDPPPWTAIDMLDRRAADVAAVMVSDGERFARRLRGSHEVVDWGTIPLVGVLPPEAGASPDPLPLRYFDGRTILLPRRTNALPSLPEAVDAALRRHGIVPNEVRTVDTIQTCLPLIEAGTAAAILPDPDSASLSRFNVVVRPLQPAVKPLNAYLVIRPGGLGNPVIRRLLEQADLDHKWNPMQ